MVGGRLENKKIRVPIIIVVDRQKKRLGRTSRISWLFTAPRSEKQGRLMCSHRDGYSYEQYYWRDWATKDTRCNDKDEDSVEERYTELHGTAPLRRMHRMGRWTAADGRKRRLTSKKFVYKPVVNHDVAVLHRRRYACQGGCILLMCNEHKPPAWTRTTAAAQTRRRPWVYQR